MIAAYEGHFDVVECLVNQCQADIDFRDCNGKRAFDKAKTNQIQYVLSSAAIEKRLQRNAESTKAIQSAREACKSVRD